MICPKHLGTSNTEAEQALTPLAKLFKLKPTEQPPLAPHSPPAGMQSKPRQRENKVDAEIYQHLCLPRAVRPALGIENIAPPQPPGTNEQQWSPQNILTAETLRSEANFQDPLLESISEHSQDTGADRGTVRGDSVDMGGQS